MDGNYKNDLSSNFDYFGFVAVPYKDFDIMLTDFDEDKLENIGISQDIEHLSHGTFPDSPFPVEGYLHGPFLRCMAPLVFRRSRKPNSPSLNVWCLIDTASPYTCLSVKTLEGLLGAENVSENRFYSFAIQKPDTEIECQVSRVGSHFEHANVIGMYAFRQLRLSLDIDWTSNRFQLIQK